MPACARAASPRSIACAPVNLVSTRGLWRAAFLCAFTAMEAQATIAAIVALQKRADTYASSTKCAYAAAAEKNQEAIVLAQRLPGLSEDNLVVLYLQAERCRYLTTQAARMSRLVGYQKTDECQVFVSAASSSFSLVTAALYHRMDAGTLEPGRCALLEEAWYDAFRVPSSGLESGEQVTCGRFVGLATMDLAAHVAFMQAIYVEWFGPVLHQTLPLVVRALDSLNKVRPLEDTVVAASATVVRTMQRYYTDDVIKRITAGRPDCFRLLRRIGDAWARVQASGVPQLPGLSDATDSPDAFDVSKRSREAVDAREARRGLRSCELASCGAKEAHVDHFKRCGACWAVVYCCREHQLEDWPAHKAACKAARKAAAAGQ